MIFDNLLQEYILSIIEFYPFVSDSDLKEDMANSAQVLIAKWEEQLERKNSIFNEINEKAAAFIKMGEI